MNMPRTQLTNGLTVANFSSPHPFNFTDGSVIPACSPERAKGLMLECIEDQVENPDGWTDIRIKWRLSDAVINALCDAEEEAVDVVLVPFPVMTAMKEAGRPVGKFRVIRVADRVTKAIHTDRFCV